MKGGTSIDILFGHFDKYFQVFLILMVVDYLSGISAAIYQKKINSSVGFKGIVKKFGILLCISVARQIDILELYDNTVAVRSTVLLFFTINELFSILENLSRMQIPLPGIFQSILEKNKSLENGLNAKNEKNTD